MSILLNAFLSENNKIYNKYDKVVQKRQKLEDIHAERSAGKHRSFRLSRSPEHIANKIKKVSKKEEILKKSAVRMDKLRDKWHKRFELGEY